MPVTSYFSAILELIELPPGSVLFVDDRTENVDSARELGLHAVEFKRESGARELRRNLGEFGIHAI